MTTLSILGGDFEILFDDDDAGSGGTAVKGVKMVRRAAGASATRYTTLALYSAIAEVTDDFLAMDFENPMLPVTPNSFTMESNYFMPRSTIEWLKEGEIKADWTFTGGEGVVRKGYTITTNFVVADIGLEVLEVTSGDTGTLLDFEQDPSGQWYAWIRPETSGDTFASTSGNLEVTTDGGVGSNVASIAADSGDNQYVAIQAIGSVPTATEVYLVQDRFKMTDWEGNFQWWDTDPSVSLGIISILVRTQMSGVLIAEGDVEVFARRYTSLYDNFRLNIVAGGFQALPLASSADINNTTGYLRITGAGGSGTFTVGNGIYNGGTWATATSRAVITAVGGTGSDPILQYYLVGDLTDLTTAAATEYDFVAEADGDAAYTSAGASVANLLGPTDTASGEGGSVTFALGPTEVDHDGDGTAEPWSITIDAQGPGASGVPAAKVYERAKYATRRGAPNTDLFGAGVNVPGETYRGVEVVAETDSVAAFGDGEDVDIVAKSSFSARSVANHDTRSPPHVSFMDIQTSLQSIADNDAIRDEGLDTVTVENGAGATLFFAGAGGGIQTFFSSNKASPFGTFTGSQIFGARCVVYINPHDDDTQNYILTDDLGVLRSPPNTVPFTQSNLLAGDRVMVARDTGVAGVIDKDKFGGMTAVAASSKTITVAGSIDTEVAPAGYLRVVENTLLQEHKYHYSSRTGTTIFNLVDITASTANDTGATTTPTLLNDSTASFQTEGVVPGMLIQDTTNGDTYEVVSLVSGFEETRINIVQVFGTGGTLASGDAYTINETIQLYAVTDDIFDLILDIEATGTSESNTFVKTLAANFGVVVYVRRGKSILPFAQNVIVIDTGGGSTTVRAPDTIAV